MPWVIWTPEILEIHILKEVKHLVFHKSPVLPGCHFHVTIVTFSTEMSII